jgi:hypothetical protein
MAQHIQPVMHKSNRYFFLTESRECPSEADNMKRELADNEPFSSPFIGASNEECQKFLLDYQDIALFLEPNIIGIADARTAVDGTILVQWYNESEGWDLEPYGMLPGKAESFWDFRIRPEDVQEVAACLNFVDPDLVFPVYFGRKEELTSKEGVFDVEGAKEMMREVAGAGKEDA